MERLVTTVRGTRLRVRVYNGGRCTLCALFFYLLHERICVSVSVTEHLSIGRALLCQQTRVADW